MRLLPLLAMAALLLLPAMTTAGIEENIYNPGQLPPTDSELAVSVGEQAPDFALPSISGNEVRLSDYRGEKNVMLSFVPAAWTPVCSGQWPGYNLVEDMFAANDTVVLGISTDNVPTLHAWVQAMGGLWFPVLSDFWPHGEAAKKYGVLRSDGTTERAIFLVDKQGVLQYIDVHDINKRPELGRLMQEIEKLQ